MIRIVGEKVLFIKIKNTQICCDSRYCKSAESETKGIQVIRIFMGSASSGEVAGRFLGKNLIKIRNISDFFTQAVGRVLKLFFMKIHLHNILRYIV